MRAALLLAVLAGTPTLAAETIEASIIVTGRGLPAPAGAAAYSSTVIGRDRLTGDASGRLEDVLRDVAGFQQFRRTDSRSANPTSQGATLRAIGGNASSRALVLLDGVPQADPFAGFIPWSALAPGGLAAARVTRGGGAGPFGAGAVAGTIELFSAGPAELPPVSLAAAGGSFGASELSGALAAPLGGGGFVTLAGNWQRGDGYILTPPDQAGPADVPARYDSKVAALRMVTAAGETGELQVSARAFDDSRLRGLAGTDSNSRGVDSGIRLIGRGRWGYEALGYLQLRRFASGFVAVDAARAVVTPTLDQFDTPATGVGGKFELRPPVGAAHTLQLGVDARGYDGATNERFRYVAGRFTRLRRAGGHNLTLGGYAEGSWKLGDAVTLTGGARLDWWCIAGGALTERDLASGAVTQAAAYPDRSGVEPTARGGVVVRLAAPVTLRAAGYLGFRLPTLNELYRPFRVGADATAANAALGLEKLRGAEAGFDWQPLPSAKLSVTAYWNRLNGAIGNVTQGFGPGVFPQVGFVAAGGAYRVRQNLDAVTVRGVEANASLALGDWALTASLSVADPRVEASGIAAALDGLRPANSPPVQASGTAAWARSGYAASATLRYTSAQFDDDLNLRRLPPATTVDGAVTVPLGPHLALTGRVENLFDALVVSGASSSGVIDRATPRTFWVGLRWQ